MHNQFKTQKFKHLMLAMGPRDLNSAPYSPVHCSSHSMTSFQSSELTELQVLENSQLGREKNRHAHRLQTCVCPRPGEATRQSLFRCGQPPNALRPWLGILPHSVRERSGGVMAASRARATNPTEI